MRSLRNINYLIHNRKYFRCVRSSISQYLVLLYVLALGYPSSLFAGETYPDCFPVESAWENIQFETTLSDNQIQITGLDEHEVSLTFNNFESYLYQFYGFVFLKKDIQNIPAITESAAFEQQFRNVKMVTLGSKRIAGNGDNKSYRFYPSTEGTWVIYLVAAINKIPFLEQKTCAFSHKLRKHGEDPFSVARP